MTKKLLPNFLIVGAAKSGTSSLHYYLNQHPQIFMPSYTKEGIKIKEPMFLVKDSVQNRVHNGIWDFEEYKNIFETEKNDVKAVGEATVFYLNFYEEAITNIKKYLGEEVKIIIILRNPVDRAYSAYHHTLRNNPHEDLEFEEALKVEEIRYNENKNITPMTLYKSMGMYFEMVKAYKENFKNVKVILYDDFEKNTSHVVGEVFTFLGVNDNYQINFKERVNVGGWNWKNNTAKGLYLNQGVLKKALKKIVMPFPGLKKYLKKNLFENKKMVVPEINEYTRKYLQDFYREDIFNISKLIGRDLSNWLKQ